MFFFKIGQLMIASYDNQSKIYKNYIQMISDL